MRLTLGGEIIVLQWFVPGHPLPHFGWRAPFGRAYHFKSLGDDSTWTILTRGYAGQVEGVPYRHIKGRAVSPIDPR